MLVPAVTFPPLWLVKLAERFCSTALTGFSCCSGHGLVILCETDEWKSTEDTT